MSHLRSFVLLLSILLGGNAFSQLHTLPLLNEKSGISLELSGRNEHDWVVERSYHAPAIADQWIYVKSPVQFRFSHNAHNSLMNRNVKIPPVPGELGADGIADSGDEGRIVVKIDRDLQSHAYSSVGGTLPEWLMVSPRPFHFGQLSYGAEKPVLGSIGDNGAPWGKKPRMNPDRFAYGQQDEFGNEWHTVTYWDDDGPVYKKAGANPHRQGASDGHWVYVCVNPVTPILQLISQQGAQFYTTPKKTYHVPRTWPQRSYADKEVLIHFVNLQDEQPVQYRIDDGKWQTYLPNSTRPLTAGELVTQAEQTVILSYRIGDKGPIARRPLTVDPAFPAPEEIHGRLLWPDDTSRAYHLNKLQVTQPFAAAYSALTQTTVIHWDQILSPIRSGWRSGAASASKALAFAFIATVDGIEQRPDYARAAKVLLLRLSRLEAVGNEADINKATPSKDYLNELSQTIQLYTDAGIAYDLLAEDFRSDKHPEGMTPIEELRIRDGLAEVAKTILQHRSNWSFKQGGGDTHWAHGYEVMFGTLAAAMPTYQSAYFGISGVSASSLLPEAAGDGSYWQPFPGQPVTWWDCATDPDIDTPGFPNIRSPFRAEMLYTDDGWWVGPNEFKGDGDRYHAGVKRRQLVDLDYGGMSNAECRVELVEMDGYEAPFATRLYLFRHFRRHLDAGPAFPHGAATYLRRRVMGGYTPLKWNADEKIYLAQPPVFTSSFAGFTLDEDGARYPQARQQMSELLTDIARYYRKAEGTPSPQAKVSRKALAAVYPLALCANPADLPPPEKVSNHAPLLKPMMKHVVQPGERVHKTIIAQDLDEDLLTLTLQGLPRGASYDDAKRTLDWSPTNSDLGIHLIVVSADDGQVTTEAPFLVIVKSSSEKTELPVPPGSVAVLRSGSQAEISWQPSVSEGVSHTIIYRDGIPRKVLPASETHFSDPGLLPGTHTRYYLSALHESGSESSTVSPPQPVHRPLDEHPQ